MRTEKLLRAADSVGPRHPRGEPREPLRRRPQPHRPLRLRHPAPKKLNQPVPDKLLSVPNYLRGSAPDACDGDGSDFRSPDHKERLLPGRYVTTLLLRGNTRPRKFGETGAWISLAHEWRKGKNSGQKIVSLLGAKPFPAPKQTAVSSNRLFKTQRGGERT